MDKTFHIHVEPFLVGFKRENMVRIQVRHGGSELVLIIVHH